MDSSRHNQEETPEPALGQNGDFSAQDVGNTETDSHITSIAHFRNQDIPSYWRMGIPVYFLLVLGLLVASDVGSGVVAISRTTPAPNDTFNKPVEQVLLEASVFSSIKELWKTGSYALTVFVVLMSVSWPYFKIGLSLYAWMMPIHNLQRRSRLLTALEALGKWAFVDVVVFLEIVVAFRSTIPLSGGVTLDVWILPQWGLFGFVSATMANLIGTHVISYFHRRVTSHPIENQEKNGEEEPHEVICLVSQSKGQSVYNQVVAGCLFLSTVLYIAGCSIPIFRIVNSRGSIIEDPVDYSIVSIGTEIGSAGRSGESGKMRWMQIVWFLLVIAAPVLSAMLFLVVFLWKASQHHLGWVLFAAEITAAWSCAEVFWISTLFAVSEMPKFGDGLIEEGCDTCYVVDSKILTNIALLSLGTVGHRWICWVAVGKARSSIYQSTA